MTENNTSLCFVDSNIWLYAFSTNDKEENKRILAKQLIQEKEIVISTQVVNEVSFNLFKKHKLDESSILNLINSFYNRYQIIQFNQNIYELASNVRGKYCFSFWDSLIIASALFADVNIFYSEDMQHKLTIEKKLTIINPFN
ncbi:MAG: PIN domain-containing protein [Cyanobacterium sp. T60_A2020_053]|nr:PIN domain-containing protein [Cyanobacterium sp. T60_A2020_053]